MKTRLYHIVAINEKTGVKTLLTAYPMTHVRCLAMKDKFTAAQGVRIQLEEIPHSHD